MNFLPVFRFPTICLFGIFLISFSPAATPDYEIGKWANFCQAAVTHTFDDNTAHQLDSGQMLFDAKGFHMTLFVSTGQISDWTKYKAAFAKGHEIASHSVTHPITMPDAECATSQAAIKKNVPGEMCVTIAYPNCNIPTSTVNLKKCYIAGRTCDSQIVAATPPDFWRTGSRVTGNAGINTVTDFNNKANQAASSGGWGVYLSHGVANDNHGFSNTPTAVFKGNLAYLDTNRSKFWVETFGNVARYIYERDSSKITLKSSTTTSFTITVTNNLPDSIFNYPLSIRRTLPVGWTTAFVTQKGAAVQSSIVTVNATQYIMFKAIPNIGDIVISQTATATTHIPSLQESAGTNPIKIRNKTLIINSQRFNGSSMTITLFDIKGKLIGHYTIGSRNTHITLPLNTIGSSAIIAKITGGNKTYCSRFIFQN